MAKKYGKWTEELIRLHSKECKLKSEFKRKYAGAYRNACKLGIINDLGFIEIKKPNGYWTEEALIKKASEYTTIKDFVKEQPSAYSQAQRKGIIEKLNLESSGNRFNRCVYAIEFKDKSIYIGLTYNFEIRIYDHFYTKRVDSSAQKYYSKYKIPYFSKTLTDYIDFREAAKLESFFIEKYKNDGYNVLNKAKAGALGGNVTKWTKEKALKVISKYKNYTEIVKSKDYGAYRYASKHKFINELKYNKDSLNKEKILQLALKYDKPIDFRRSKDKGAYYYAMKYGFLKELKYKNNENIIN